MSRCNAAVQAHHSLHTLLSAYGAHCLLVRSFPAFSRIDLVLFCIWKNCVCVGEVSSAIFFRRHPATSHGAKSSEMLFSFTFSLSPLIFPSSKPELEDSHPVAYPSILGLFVTAAHHGTKICSLFLRYLCLLHSEMKVSGLKIASRSPHSIQVSWSTTHAKQRAHQPASFLVTIAAVSADSTFGHRRELVSSIMTNTTGSAVDWIVGDLQGDTLYKVG